MTSYRTLSSFWKNIGQKKNGEIRLLYTKRVQANHKVPTQAAIDKCSRRRHPHAIRTCSERSQFNEIRHGVF